jgi:exonuclease III
VCVEVVKILNYNIRSLRNKHEELSIHLGDLFGKTCQLDLRILCLTETWLPDSEYIPLDSFRLVSAFGRSQRRGGGVSIYVGEDVPAEKIEITNPHEMDFEVTAASIGGNNSLLVICVYRPPRGDINTFLSEIEKLLDSWSLRFRMIVIVGDFNINFENTIDPNTCRINLLMSTFGLVSTVNSATRVTNRSATAIDNMYINFDLANCHVNILDIGLSDHYGQTIEFYPLERLTAEKSTFTMRRNFNAKNKKRFTDFLVHCDWSCVYSSSSIDEKFKLFQNILIDGLNRSFPLNKLKNSNNRFAHKWISPELKYLCNKKRDIQLFAKKWPTVNQYKLQLKCINSQIKDTIKKLKSIYTTNIINRSDKQNKTKQIWHIINKELKEPHVNNFPQIKDGLKLLCPNEAATEFNKYFIKSVEDLEPTSLSCSHDSFQNNQFYKGKTFDSFPVYETMYVERVSSRLKSKMSSGIDGIPCRILKDIFPLISEVAAHLFNESLSTGIFPNCFKTAKVVPIFKKGSKNNIENYRPIAQLPSLSKILEKIVYNELVNHLEKNRILSPSQFGFRKGMSTGTAVTSFINNVLRKLDGKHKVTGLFLDLTKAFDCINHVLLLEKLKCVGIRGVVFEWLKSYLSDRCQIVELTTLSGELSNEKFYSDRRKVYQGVPQGSILGPLLFLIYINDLPNCIGHLETIMFADDVSFFVSAKDYRTVVHVVHSILEQLGFWLSSNGLKANVSKSCFLEFGLRGTNSRIGPEESIYPFNDDYLKVQTSTNFLGIYLDNSLNWIPHITNLCSRLGKIKFLFYRLTKFLDKNVLINVYFAHVDSIIRYGIEVWGSSCHSIHVFRLQKQFVRMLNRKPRRFSCRGLFRQSKILTLASIYLLQLGVLAYKSTADWTIGSEVHGYNTRHNSLVRLDRHRTSAFECAPDYMSKKIFNTLPNEIKSTNNIKAFKKRLSVWLCEKEYYTINEFFAG